MGPPLCPLGSLQFPLGTNLVHHQKVLYGVPVGKDHVSSVLHSLRQDLLHLLGDDTWGQAKCVWREGVGTLSTSCKEGAGAGEGQVPRSLEVGSSRVTVPGVKVWGPPGWGKGQIPGSKNPRSRGQGSRRTNAGSTQGKRGKDPWARLSDF